MDAPRPRGVVVVLLVAVAAFVYLLVELVLATGDVDWLWDFSVFYASVERLAATGSLYMPEQLNGPFEAICDGCYCIRRPSGSSVPITLIPLVAAKAIWFPLMMAVAWLSVWLAASIGGARRTLESASLVVRGHWLLPAGVRRGLERRRGQVPWLVRGLGRARIGRIAGVSAGLATLLKVWPGRWCWWRSSRAASWPSP